MVCFIYLFIRQIFIEYILYANSFLDTRDTAVAKTDPAFMEVIFY